MRSLKASNCVNELRKDTILQLKEDHGIFFKKAIVDMSDNDLIESWYRTAHSNYGNLISNISLLCLNCD